MKAGVHAEDVGGWELEVDLEGVRGPSAEELDDGVRDAGQLGRGSRSTTPGVTRELGRVLTDERQVLANGLDRLGPREVRAVGEGEERGRVGQR